MKAIFNKVFGGKKEESEPSSNDWEAKQLPFEDNDKCRTFFVAQNKDDKRKRLRAKCQIVDEDEHTTEELMKTAGITFIQTGDGDDKRLTVNFHKLAYDGELSKKKGQRALILSPVKNLAPENDVTMTFFEDDNGTVESINFEYSVRDTSMTTEHRAGECPQHQETTTRKAYATFFLKTKTKERITGKDFVKLLDGAAEIDTNQSFGNRPGYVARLYRSGELKEIKAAEAEAEAKRQAEAAAEAEAAEKARIAAEAEAAEKARAAAEQARIVAAEEAQKAAEQAEQDQVDSAQAELDRKRKLDKRIFDARREWFWENRKVDLEEIEGHQFLRRLAANEPMENDFTLFCTLPLLVIFVFWFKRYIVTSKNNDDNEIVEDNVNGDENDLNNIV